MASSPRITVLLCLSAVALWRCIGTAPAYGQITQPSGQTTHPYLFRVFSHEVYAVRPSVESLPLAPAAQESHSEALNTRDDVWSKTEQGRSNHANKPSVPDVGGKESRTITTLPAGENVRSLQWHSLAVYTPTLRAHAGKPVAELPQANNLSGMMSSSTSTSAVVDAMYARKWQPQIHMKARQPPRSAGTPVSDPEGGAVSDLQPTEETSENSTLHDFILSDIPRAPLKKKKRLQQKDEANSAEQWPLLTPAHVVDGLLRYPDDSEGRSDLTWYTTDTESLLSNLDDEFTSGDIQDARDAETETDAAESSSERRQELGGQGQASAQTEGESRPLNEGQNIMKEIYTNSAASVLVGPTHQVKVARQNEARDCIPYGSCRHVDGRQSRTRQVRQREQPQQQRIINGVGAATSRRLSSSPWADTAQHALQRLQAAQEDVASLLATATMPFKKEADAPERVKPPSHKRKSKRTTRKHQKDSSGTRTTRSKKSKYDKDFSSKSLSAAYHRFVKQEAKAMNYRGDKWESFPLPFLAFFAVLALMGHPLMAVYGVSFVALDQLVQLDSMLEQHALLHLRARRRLLKQFLRVLKKEHDEREEKEVTTSPEQSAANNISRLRLDQGKYLNTAVVAAFSPQDGKSDTSHLAGRKQRNVYRNGPDASFPRYTEVSTATRTEQLVAFVTLNIFGTFLTYMFLRLPGTKQRAISKTYYVIRQILGADSVV